MKKIILCIIFVLSVFINVQALEVIGRVNDDNVRIRKLPILQKDVIVRNVNSGDEVKIVGISNFEQSIGRYRSRWYQIEMEDKQYWVYGVFVDVDISQILQVPVIILPNNDLSKSTEMISKRDIEHIIESNNSKEVKWDILGKTIPDPRDVEIVGNDNKPYKYRENSATRDEFFSSDPADELIKKLGFQFYYIITHNNGTNIVFYLSNERCVLDYIVINLEYEDSAIQYYGPVEIFNGNEKGYFDRETLYVFRRDDRYWEFYNNDVANYTDSVYEVYKFDYKIGKIKKVDFDKARFYNEAN